MARNDLGVSRGIVGDDQSSSAAKSMDIGPKKTLHMQKPSSHPAPLSLRRVHQYFTRKHYFVGLRPELSDLQYEYLLSYSADSSAIRTSFDSENMQRSVGCRFSWISTLQQQTRNNQQDPDWMDQQRYPNHHQPFS